MQKLDKSKLVMNLGKKYKLAPYLDKVMTTFDEPFEFKYESKIHDNAWHPSGDCTPTALELYEKACLHLETIDLEPDDEDALPEILSESLRKSFMVGHFWHQLLQHIVLKKLEFCEPWAIERKGMRVWQEDNSYGSSPSAKLATPAPFGWATGSGDLAPLVLPSGWQGVVDFKTMNSRTFKQNIVPFADKYECQINIYMDFFGEDKALILGINKDTPHDFKEFEYERNNDLISAIYNKWEYVSECLDSGIAPTTDDVFELPLKGPVSI